jgi:hypothetical protein
VGGGKRERKMSKKVKEQPHIKIKEENILQ